MTAATGLLAIGKGMSSWMDSGGDALAEATPVSIMGLRPTDLDIDAVCANTGYAYSSGSDGAPAGAPAQNSAEYAARNAFCGLRKSPDGPDTAKGALDRVQAFICAVGDVTFDGVERDVTIAINTTCFSQAFTDMATTEGLTSATVKVTGFSDPTVAGLGGSADYENGILIDLSSVMGANSFYKIQYTGTATKFVASMVSIDGGVEDWVMRGVYDRTDAANSVLRVEGRFFGNNDDPDSRRFMRALVKGTTSGTEFTSPSLVEYVLFDVYTNSGTPSSVTYNTIKGNSTDGYFAWYGTENQSGEAALAIVPTTTDSVCLGDGPCTGNSGLTVDTLAKTAFFKSAFSSFTSEYQAPGVVFSGGGPLTFDALSFDATID